MTTTVHTLPYSEIDPALNPVIETNDTWRELRTRHPISRCESEEGVFWVLAKHQHATAMYRNAAVLSSTHGNVLRTLLASHDPAEDGMMSVMDPPRHGKLRKAIRHAFTESAMTEVLTSVRTATRELVDQALDAGTIDFVDELAAQVPLVAICELLAVPIADREYMLKLTMNAFATENNPRNAASRVNLLAYFRSLIQARRESPGDDVVSLLATLTIDGVPLTDAEVIYNCYVIMIGGDETSRLSAAGGLLALMRNPDQWDRLKSDPTVLDTAVEEILRWTTPAVYIGRHAKRDTTIGGVDIAAGDVVTAWNVSANRDEEIFTDPYRFDITRTPNRHLGLGHGPHFCVGSALARQELRIMLDALRDKVDSATLVGPVEYESSSLLTGLSRLPVTLR